MKYNVGVLFTTDNIDTRSNDGELRLSLMATLAQEESRKISSRVNWATKRNYENGVAHGTMPYGYKRENGKIVIVEDEPVTQARLQSYFTQEGYTVSVTASGAGLREIMQNQSVDLILLDINLPDENGLMLTRALRERSTVGIILVTGRSDRIDRIVGLGMGGDDYVTKPLELRELVGRVKNLLWRIDPARQAQPHTQDNCYRFAGYCLNVSRHTLERDGEPIKLTRAEYEMLVAFVTNPGEILSRERLLRMLSARRVENPDLRTVDVLIRRLRHKLSADLLVTQHGEGYFLAADVC